MRWLIVVPAVALAVACSSPTTEPHRLGGGSILSDADRLRLNKSPLNVGARADTDSLLGTTPVWTTRTVFIQSDDQWNTDGTTQKLTDPTTFGCDPGQPCWDGRDGTDIAKPFLSITGFENYYDLARPRDGLFLDVVLLADNRDSDWDAANKIVAHGRVYWQDEIYVGASTSFLHSVTFRGPRGGFKKLGEITLLTHADETYNDPTYGNGLKTGCVKLHFSTGSASIGSYHLGWYRNDGREAVFPLAASTDDPVGGFSYICGLNDASIGNILTAGTTGGQGNHFFPWFAAVLIHTSLGDGQMRGVHIYGQAGGRIGDRTAANDPRYDPNIRGLFSRVQIGRSWWDVTGSYYIGEGVRLSDNAYFALGQPRLRGVSIEGHVTFTSRAPLLNNSSQLTLTEEPVGYMAAYTLSLSVTSGTGVNDPDYPIVGPDFSISTTADSYVQVGDDVLGATGQLRIFHGAGIRLPDAGVAIRVMGKGSAFFEEKFNVIGVVLSSTQTGLWCEDGATCAVDDASKDTLQAFDVGLNISGTDLVYRAGNSPAATWGMCTTRWAQGTVYSTGNRRCTDPSAGGNGYLYQVTTGGTSSGAGSGPTGTGSDIVDGTVHWKFVAAGALRDPHGFNGYLTHRLDKSANGYATDEDASIRDRTWEASGYTTGR
jgi:hypothetical protein